MERLNWALLGLMGIITALGLTTSSGAGKTRTSEQPLSVSTATDAPACSACRSHAATTPVATVTPATTKSIADEPCPGNCHETGVCCDKSLPKTDTAVAAKTETQACEGECCLSKKSVGIADGKSSATQGFAICGDGTCKSVSGEIVSADCPLTKAAEMIENLTKNYVCEGGECLTKPGQGTLILKPIEESAKPEGLSNLLAAAEAAKVEAKPENSAVEIVPGGITVESKPVLNFIPGTLTLTDTTDPKVSTGTLTISGTGIVPGAKPAVDNSRAAARAAKLAQLEAKMAQPWTLAFNETPLTQAVEALQAKFRVPVLLDRRAFDESGIDPATPLTADQQPEIEAGEFLRGYLRNHGLTWMIPASNDRILITTIGAMEGMPINRVYDVTDLIDENHGAEGIVERIQSLVEPQSWKAVGGQGDLTVWQKENRVSLVCSNTYWTQRAIAELLEDLRLGTKTERPLENQSSIRLYRLPMIASYLTNDPKFNPTTVLPDREKLVDKQKSLLQTVLAANPAFDPTIFQIYEYDYKPILVTKQVASVHRAVERLVNQLSAQPNDPLHCGSLLGPGGTIGFGNP